MPDAALSDVLQQPIDQSLGQGFTDTIQLNEDFNVFSIRGAYSAPYSYQTVGEGWTRLHFRSCGEVTMDFQGIQSIETSGPVCSILQHPEGVIDECISQQVPAHWVTLFFRNTFLLDYLALSSQQLPPALRTLSASNRADFMFREMPLQPDMRQCLLQLSQADYSGPLRRLYLESKANELLCMMVRFLSNTDEKPYPMVFSRRDKEALDEARSILDSEFTTPPTIEQLAFRVKINRNKLTYGFRHFMGATVSDYCRQQCFSQAIQYLRDTDKPINLIADISGFTRATSFSAAFKKYTGLTPRQVRQGAALTMQAVSSADKMC